MLLKLIVHKPSAEARGFYRLLTLIGYSLLQILVLKRITPLSEMKHTLTMINPPKKIIKSEILVAPKCMK